MEFLRQLINGLCGKIRLKLNKKNHIKKMMPCKSICYHAEIQTS